MAQATFPFSYTEFGDILVNMGYAKLDSEESKKPVKEKK